MPTEGIGSRIDNLYSKENWPKTRSGKMVSDLSPEDQERIRQAKIKVEKEKALRSHGASSSGEKKK